MEIIFHGRHDSQEASESIKGIICLLKERYAIEGFREMHLSITLLDGSGMDVELVDSETDEAYRVFEVFRQAKEVPKRRCRPQLKLVVDKEPTNVSPFIHKP